MQKMRKAMNTLSLRNLAVPDGKKALVDDPSWNHAPARGRIIIIAASSPISPFIYGLF
jgi:hypothetical protein